MNDQLQTVQRSQDQTPVPLAGMGAGVEIAQSRVAQEVQAAMVVAKKFPRDEDSAWKRIEKACCRPRMAGASQYSYSRGGQQITGPSIRLAELLAQNWGNIDFGTVEIEQRDGESLMMTYCWDLESNSRSTKLFVVPHIREKRDRQTNTLEQIALQSARDIYEMTANMGARRLRSCILAVIPGDIQERAIEVCNETIGAEFDDDVRATMVAAFQDQFGVTAEQLETFIGRKLKRFDAGNYVRLRHVYQTLLDGFAKVSDIFPPPANINGQARSKFGFNGQGQDATPDTGKGKKKAAHKAKAAVKPGPTPAPEPVVTEPEPEPEPEAEPEADPEPEADWTTDLPGKAPFVCSRCEKAFEAYQVPKSCQCPNCFGKIVDVKTVKAK